MNKRGKDGERGYVEWYVRNKNTGKRILRSQKRSVRGAVKRMLRLVRKND